MNVVIADVIGWSFGSEPGIWPARHITLSARDSNPAPGRTPLRQSRSGASPRNQSVAFQRRFAYLRNHEVAYGPQHRSHREADPAPRTAFARLAGARRYKGVRHLVRR